MQLTVEVSLGKVPTKELLNEIERRLTDIRQMLPPAEAIRNAAEEALAKSLKKEMEGSALDAHLKAIKKGRRQSRILGHKIERIKRLKKAGNSINKISTLTGISYPTVKRYFNE